jgi:hypothetical protein
LLSGIDTRHLDLLRALFQSPTTQEMSMSISAPITTIQRRTPNLREDLNVIIHDTNALGLTNVRDNSLHTNMTGGGAANLQGAVTSLGKELLTFVSEVEPA